MSAHLSYRIAYTLAQVLLRGRTDKAGLPEFEHALRVREALQVPDTDIRATVALLHDLVEDTDLYLTQLASFGFSPAVIAAVDAITRRSGEAYADYIDRVALDPVARDVKLADLQDHLRPMTPPFELSPSLAERYRKAAARLHYETQRTLASRSA